MPRIRSFVAAVILLIPFTTGVATQAAAEEKRIALVVGNAAYQAGALATPANDAGLIAQTLQAAGFDVVGARDLDQDALRRALRDFLDKAAAAGPETVAFVYLGGHGLQLEGENYFVPVDAKIPRDTDVAVEAVRVSDYARSLAALKLKASIVVLDAARAHPFARTGAPLAGGLALVEPEAGTLIAFNATPGTIAPEAQGPYGPYAQALAEMIREGGLPLATVFERVRLRVNDVTKGAEVAWHASKVEAPFVFFERTAEAPPPPVPPEQTAAIRTRSIRELPVQEAYALALERDTLQGYSEFVAAYPDDPLAKRVEALAAARREAITWRRSRGEDTPAAYWSYLKRYPEGPHTADARRRLGYLSMAYEPPPTFTPIEYDVPPPPPAEIVYVRRPVLMLYDPVYAFAPPPFVPVVFLAPPPPAFIVLGPPPPPIGLYVLPCPVYRPIPIWVRPPLYIVAPPAHNVIYANVHNTVVINNVTNTVAVTNPAGQTKTFTPPTPTGAGAHATGIGPALPPSVAQKAASMPTQPGGQPGGMGAHAPLGQPLPGAKGQPLPSGAGGTTPGTPGAKPTTPTGLAKGANPGGTANPPSGQPGTKSGTTPTGIAKGSTPTGIAKGSSPPATGMAKGSPSTPTGLGKASTAPLPGGNPKSTGPSGTGAPHPPNPGPPTGMANGPANAGGVTTRSLSPNQPPIPRSNMPPPPHGPGGGMSATTSAASMGGAHMPQPQPKIGPQPKQKGLPK